MSRIASLLFILLFSLTAMAGGMDSVLMIKAGQTRIPPYAYKDREDIREVRFEKGSQMKEIGEYAFLGCSNLKKIDLPESLVKIGEGALRECTSLESLVIPRGVKALPKALCAWDSSLRSVVLPAGLEDIGSHAFAYCSSLDGVKIPAGVKHIGSNVFSRCFSLTEIALPSSIKELESYVFSDCVRLRKATLPANKNMLGEYMFSGCVALEELVELSPVPPTFDCNSTIFEDSETGLYRKCRLIVPAGSESLYRNAPGWQLFYKDKKAELSRL